MTTPPSAPARPAPVKRRRISLAHRVPPPSGHYRWVYLWEWPIRTMHWIAAGCILVLVVTGLYIGKPYFVSGAPESSDPFLMGWMRFLHFTAAGLLVMTGIVRVYWLFAGNKFERFAALFPVRPRDWVNLVRQVKYYLMIQPEKAPRYLGHNPLQQLSYTGVYLLAVIMVLTGFAMYGQSDPDGFFYRAFGWVGTVLGGMPVARFIHHVAAWLFLVFIPIHVYLAIRADNLERTGVISSIFSGGRFVPADETFEDQDGA
ncbi:MAG TPA: Ni/Fe-hydrogenase, b-type cytochrome subunit [Gemmatimonadales bacterium]|jgi:Ni/Fe-hydrogenase b-type cytochrome subunit|nr:Ni/Fe-hydrogenase, b-type cytochrome subunit [Gemmatimonadales bacterium]